jgi:hypothetical protein
MASPFRTFRRYQKTFIVVGLVILTFVFVIGDSLVAYLGGSRGGGGATQDAQAVAVSWDGGSLTNQELDNLVFRRRIVNSFLQNVVNAGGLSAMEAGLDPRDLSVQPIMGPPTERGVVATKMLADAARNAGMRVSDEAIVRYLYELGRGHVSPDQMRAMVTKGNARVPISYVMDALREEMLAHNYLASHKYAFATVTPQQRYEDWLRLNDRIVVEAAAIPAESFVVDVPEPTEAELAQFFEQHKTREPVPELVNQVELPSPTPGFRLPRTIDVQFIKADYDALLAKIEDEITDEEISKYYEENKDPRFIKADTSFLDSLQQDLEMNAPADSAPATGTPPTDEADPASGTTTQPTTTPPPTEPMSDANGPADSGQSEAVEAPPVDADPAPADNAEPASTPATGDQSSIHSGPPKRVFRLAAFQEQAESGETTTDTATESPPPVEPVESTPAPGTAADQPTSTAVEPPPTSEATNAAPAGGESSSTTEASATGSAPGSTAASPAAASEKPKEFQSLDEVRDEIRRTLAVERTRQRLDELMNELHVQVNGEFTKYFSQRLASDTSEREPAPPPKSLIDLAPLAAEHGLEQGSTGPMSWLEMRKTPVGASGDIESQIELYRMLFGTDEVEQYKPVSTQDIDGNRYLVMKMSDTPGRVPELAEVRDEVIRAWKLAQASELAKKRAEELAEKAEAAKGPLSQALADNPSLEVIRTDPFSRLTGGDVVLIGGQPQLQPFRLSEPTGIVAAGQQFMDTVFGLKEGEVGSVLNHDRSIAYVVRVIEHQQTPDALHDAYLAEANIWPGLGIMMNEHRQLGTELLAADIFASRAVNWERDPDQPEQAEVE